MRLIDADELIKKFKRLRYNDNSYIRTKLITETLHNLVPEVIAEQPTIEAEPVKRGRWIVKEQMKLIQTGKMAVLEGHILSKTSADSPFTEREANLIRLKEHRVVKIPYCSICGNHGDDEWDRTLFCPYCGARMDGDTNEEP